MNELDELQNLIRNLAPEDLAKFRAWFNEFDHELWDRQIEADMKSGKLDGLLDEAREDHLQGGSRLL